MLIFTLAFLILSCALHVYYPPLHSFPTRRSSDLGAQAVPPRQGLHRAQQRGGDHRRVQDRKSTRLNSSHLGISYAVFCLKKKTKQQQGNQRRGILSDAAATSALEEPLQREQTES